MGSRIGKADERDRPMMKVNCPICGRVMSGSSRAEWPDYPFCSPRCRQIDLGQWLREDYGIPADEPDDVDSGDDPDSPS
jgi:endogenous inhibitor of DNA gyrase (YacG/DUF329 family)